MLDSGPRAGAERPSFAPGVRAPAQDGIGGDFGNFRVTFDEDPPMFEMAA
ncbi:hypothetical protein PHLCEN_2v1535 [Hermanssonia centrifuga]|uniref:Uncharacterized protein n=1 Tax=Hermanssonia centrifuga TaxID=98765 RepID=A0A2R6RZR7_9APHY|nr:hypothetical protein PHLCEN_2v1535 [Hermanssonia centrifuga]